MERLISFVVDNRIPIALGILVGLPLLTALLGYAIRRSRDAVAYMSLATLIVSALAALWLATQIEKDDRGGDMPHQLTLGSIALPSEITVRNIEANVPPQDKQRYLQGIGAFLAQNPAVQAMTVRLSTGRAQLLFAATTALIAALCLLFALWERRGDPRRGTFFATVTLFTSAMLLFICADTLLLVYLAWELMGLCSFLLIGYPATARARRAAREAFWTTRATDFGLLLAVIIMMGRFGWMTLSDVSVNALLLDLMQVQQQNPEFNALGAAQAQIFPWLGAVAFLALLATLGKLAMFPLSFWLSNAMAAPTPVSALLHAATMVAAGPYLLTQLGPFFQYSAGALAAAVLAGSVSAVLTGLMALAARDAKRVLAYSTISQLSIAVAGVGVFSNSAALYHLLAHAWYKAPLFLAVGYLAVTASRHRGGAAHVAGHSGSEDDPDDHTLLQRLAGSARRAPLALWTLLLACAALAGLIGTGGYYGKEQVLLALLTRWKTEYAPGHTFGADYPLAAAAWTVGSILLVLSIPITAAYTARLVGILGWGKGGAIANEQKVHLPLLPLLLAALIGCIGAGVAVGAFRNFITPTGDEWRWVESSPAGPVVLGLDILLITGAITFAVLLNVARPALGAQVVAAGKLGPLIDFFAHGMRLREFWHGLVGRGGALLAALSQRGELKLDRVMVNTGRDGRRLAIASAWVERHIVDGLRYWVAEIWWAVRRGHQRFLQTGSIQHYMLVILLSAVLLSFLILRPMAKAFKEIFERMG